MEEGEEKLRLYWKVSNYSRVKVAYWSRNSTSSQDELPYYLPCRKHVQTWCARTVVHCTCTECKHLVISSLSLYIMQPQLEGHM